MRIRNFLAVVGVGAGLVGCANPPAPTARIDSGIQSTGSAGMAGGAAAAAPGTGSVTTATHP